MSQFISGLSGVEPTIRPTTTQTNQNTSRNFADILKASIEHVNQAQLLSKQKTEALAHGEIDDLHDVMITAQKAAITLETTVQIQRKVIDAYNEIMRMQV